MISLNVDHADLLAVTAFHGHRACAEFSVQENQSGIAPRALGLAV